MGERSQNTNLAAEYHVLSMLYRLGADAYLTLGNKKSVDILIDRGGETLTIDVKGLQARNSNFPIDNWTKKTASHFLVFVSFQGKMDDPVISPEVYIVPSTELETTHPELDGQSLIYQNPKGNRQVVPAGRLRKLGERYLHNWSLLLS